MLATQQDNSPEPIEIVFATTRPSELASGEFMQFSREALESYAQQINSGRFLPVNIEHLTFLPPVGRLTAARIQQTDNNELDLIVTLESVPQVMITEIEMDTLASRGQQESLPQQSLTDAIHIMLEQRNYSEDDFQAIQDTAPFSVTEQHQWAALPPLEILFVVPVTLRLLGITKFFESFFGELGTQSAKGVADWVRDTFRRGKQPERDRLLTISFPTDDGPTIWGTAFVPADNDSIIDLAVPAWAKLAAIVENLRLHPFHENLERAMFIYENGAWHLAWYITTGDTVFVTDWFKKQAIDQTKFLSTVDAPE